MAKKPMQRWHGSLTWAAFTFSIVPSTTLFVNVIVGDSIKAASSAIQAFVIIGYLPIFISKLLFILELVIFNTIELPKELRHTYASTLIMAGVPLVVVAKQLGHADTRMVEIHYGHLAPNYVAETIRAAAPKLGILNPTPAANTPER